MTVHTRLRAALTELLAAIDAYTADPWDSDMQSQTDRYEAALHNAREVLTDDTQGQTTGEQHDQD